MVCEFCGAKMRKNMAFCPACGAAKAVPQDELLTEDGQPVAEGKKKPEAWKIIVAVIAGVLLLAVLTGAILYSLGVIDFKGPGEGVMYRDNYSVSNKKADKKGDVVIATLGNQELTNAELQAFYWMGVYEFLDNYGAYLSYFGLDINQPMNEQIYDIETGMTFQQMFLENALNSWKSYAIMVELSEQEGYVLPTEAQEFLDSIEGEVNKWAQEANYTDIELFIDEELFPGCSYDAYYEYSRISNVALFYYDSISEKLMPTDEEIEAYYTANEATFKESGFAKEDGNYYDVRHILTLVTSAAGDKTYTDADWEACLAEAEKILAEYQAGEQTEDAFAALAVKYSEDGNASTGGLYDKRTKATNFEQSFKDWYLDESRKPGDTGIVKSSYGYHVMYYCSDYAIWEYEARSAVLSENTTKFLKDAENQYTFDVNYKAIVLGVVDLAAES